MSHRKFAFAAVSLMAVVGLICAVSKGANEVPLKGKWPKQPFQPSAIFDDNFELSVKDGRIHIHCGDQLDEEVGRITYDKARDLLTLHDIAVEKGKNAPASDVQVHILVHPDRPHPGIKAIRAYPRTFAVRRATMAN